MFSLKQISCASKNRSLLKLHINIEHFNEDLNMLKRMFNN